MLALTRLSSASVTRNTWVLHLADYHQVECEQASPDCKHPELCWASGLPAPQPVFRELTGTEWPCWMPRSVLPLWLNDSARVRVLLSGREPPKHEEAWVPISSCTKTPIWRIPSLLTLESKTWSIHRLGSSYNDKWVPISPNCGAIWLSRY